MSSIVGNNQGSVGPLAGVSAAVIVLAIAVAVDCASVYSAKNKAQNALDAATISAAKEFDDQDLGKSKGTEHFNLVFKMGGISDVDVKFDYDEATVSGTFTGRKSMLFGGVLPQSFMDLKVKSRVGFPAKEGAPCIMALSQTASPGLLINSGANVVSDECEVHVHSTAHPAMTMNGGTDVDVERICVAGATVLNNSGSPVDNLERNCEVAADPYAGTYPVPALTTCKPNVTYSGNVTLTPGTYCHGRNFHGANVHFEPGTYILKDGDWNVDGGHWTGDGVTFYFYENAKIQFNSAATADMSAPTSGDYAGVFITEKAGNGPAWTDQFKINDTLGFDFEGIVYLPDYEIVFNSGSSLQGRAMNLIGNTIILNVSNLDLSPADGTTGYTSLAFSQPFLLQ